MSLCTIIVLISTFSIPQEASVIKTNLMTDLSNWNPTNRNGNTPSNDCAYIGVSGKTNGGATLCDSTCIILRGACTNYIQISKSFQTRGYTDIEITYKMGFRGLDGNDNGVKLESICNSNTNVIKTWLSNAGTGNKAISGPFSFNSSITDTNCWNTSSMTLVFTSYRSGTDEQTGIDDLIIYGTPTPAPTKN
eukprot:464074_1